MPYFQFRTKEFQDFINSFTVLYTFNCTILYLMSYLQNIFQGPEIWTSIRYLFLLHSERINYVFFTQMSNLKSKVLCDNRHWHCIFFKWKVLTVRSTEKDFQTGSSLYKLSKFYDGIIIDPSDGKGPQTWLQFTSPRCCRGWPHRATGSSLKLFKFWGGLSWIPLLISVEFSIDL